MKLNNCENDEFEEYFKKSYELANIIKQKNLKVKVK